jgi:hypothetical protein
MVRREAPAVKPPVAENRLFISTFASILELLFLGPKGRAWGRAAALSKSKP